MRDFAAFSLAAIAFIGILIWGATFASTQPSLVGLAGFVWAWGCLSFFGLAAFISAIAVGFVVYLFLS